MSCIYTYKNKIYSESEFNQKIREELKDKPSKIKKRIESAYKNYNNLSTIGSIKDFYEFIVKNSPYSILDMSDPELVPMFTAHMENKFIPENTYLSPTVSSPPDPQVSREKQTVGTIKGKIRSLREQMKKRGNKFIIQDEIEFYNNNLIEYKKGDRNIKDSTLILIAEHDILDIKERLNNTDITDDDILYILNSAILWSGIKDIYTANPNDVDHIENASNTILKQVSNIINTKLKDRGASEGFQLTDDELENLYDDGMIQSLGLDMGHSHNKLIRLADYLLKRANYNKKQEIAEYESKIKEVFKDLSLKEIEFLFSGKNSLKKEVNDSFIEKRGSFYRQLHKLKNPALFNLITELIKSKEKNNLREFKIRLNNILTSELLDEAGVKILEATINNNLSDPNIFKIIYSSLYGHYDGIKNDWENENIVILNPRAFDVTVDIAERQQLIDDFIKASGNEHYARIKIKQGEASYKKYLKDYSDFKVYIEGIHSGDLDTINNEITKWNYAHSPIIRYESQMGLLQNKIFYYNAINEYGNTSLSKLTDAPLRSKGHYNKDFERILNSPKLFKVYSLITEIMSTAREIYPDSVLEGTNAGFVYRSKAESLDLIKNSGLKNVSLSGILNGTFTKEYDYENTEVIDELKRPVSKIPTSVFKNIDKELETLKSALDNPLLSRDQKDEIKKRIEYFEALYDTDIESSMLTLVHEMLNYKYLSEVESQIKLAEYKVNKAGRRIDNTTVIPGGLDKTQNRFAYSIRALLYGKYKNVEGQLNPKELFADTHFANSTLKKRAKEIAKIAIPLRPKYEEAINKKILGEKITIEEKNLIREYQSLVREYRGLGGKRITISQAVDTAITAQQMKVLGLNPASAFFNLTFGLISSYIESVGGQFFTFKELNKSWGVMKSTIVNYLTFGKSPSSKNRDKLVNFIQKNDVLFEILEAQYGKGKVNAEFLYMWFKSTDFYMKGMNIVAMLMHDKIMDNNGKQISLWDALDENGDLNASLVDPNALEDWNNNGKFKQVLKIQKILKRLHGNMDSSSPVQYKKAAIGRALGQFRLSWLVEAAYNRWGSEREDEILGTIKGRYRSIGDYYKAFNNITGADNILVNLFNIATNPSNLKKAYDDLSDLDKANMRRNIVELMFIIGILSVGMLLKYASAGDDDDEKKKFEKYRIIINMLFRVNQDLTYYVNPDTVSGLFQNVVPSVGLITDTKKAITKSIEYIVDPTDKHMESMIRYQLKAIPLGRAIISTKGFLEDDISKYQR